LGESFLFGTQAAKESGNFFIASLSPLYIAFYSILQGLCVLYDVSFRVLGYLCSSTFRFVIIPVFLGDGLENHVVRGAIF
jgi:hypothetical protein